MKLNIDWKEIKKKITKKTKAVILVHSGGEPATIQLIAKELRKRKIWLIEDCSQASGGSYKGKKLGTFGDISSISTMFSKNLMFGGSGGIVYSKKKNYLKKMLAYSDRGKPIWKKKLDTRDPSEYLFPALNWNINEFSAAIGLASLKRLNQTVKDRLKIINMLSSEIKSKSKVCFPYLFEKGAAPYFFPIWVNTKLINCSKKTFAEAIKSEGIELNSNYKFLCSDWGWAKNQFPKKIITPNAEFLRNNSFNLFINEKYTYLEVKDIVTAILKVENFYIKK